MVSQKRAWIRILEATIAVMLIAGVLTILYSKQTQDNESAQEFLQNLQRKVLKDISSNENLRSAALNDDIGTLNHSISSYIPSHLGYSVNVCNLSAPCKLDPVTFKETLSKDVIADGTIISSNITTYAPKKVMVFLWYR